jgi:hypothetical protein
MTNQLCYRGVSYRPTVAATQKSQALPHIYRGVSYLASPHREVASQMVLGPLRYRGRQYESARTSHTQERHGQGLA